MHSEHSTDISYMDVLILLLCYSDRDYEQIQLGRKGLFGFQGPSLRNIRAATKTGTC